VSAAARWVATSWRDWPEKTTTGISPRRHEGRQAPTGLPVFVPWRLGGSNPPVLLQHPDAVVLAAVALHLFPRIAFVAGQISFIRVGMATVEDVNDGRRKRETVTELRHP
jgi:hypothetical protein